MIFLLLSIGIHNQIFCCETFSYSLKYNSVHKTLLCTQPFQKHEYGTNWGHYFFLFLDDWCFVNSVSVALATTLLTSPRGIKMYHVIGSKVPHSESMPVYFQTVLFDHSLQWSPPSSHMTHPCGVEVTHCSHTSLWPHRLPCGGGFSFTISTQNHRASGLEGTFFCNWLY